MAALSYEPERVVSIEEYLEFESKSDLKHEYCDGRMWAMAGGSTAHAIITFNVTASLGTQLRGSSCRGYSSDMRVRVPNTNLYSYPDATIACEEPEYAESGGDTLLNPTVLIEVLSPSTESFERGAKWLRYQRLASLRDYLLVAQDTPRIEHYARQDDGSWRFQTYIGTDAELQLSGAPVSVRLGEIYENITFPPEEDQASQAPQISQASTDQS